MNINTTNVDVTSLCKLPMFSYIERTNSVNQNGETLSEIFSELNSVVFSETAPDLKKIAVQTLDPFIGEMRYEGVDSREMLKEFLYFLKSIKEGDEADVLKPIIPLFEECLKIAEEVSKIVIVEKYDQPLNFEPIKKLAKELEKKAHQLKVGERMVIPGGWTDRNHEGHAMLYCVEREFRSNLNSLFLIRDQGSPITSIN